MRLDVPIVLVTGPMVGTSSWARTAERLRAAGNRVDVPDVLDSLGRVPAWHVWGSHLIDLIDASLEPILIGRSAASILVADVATKMPVSGLVILDGHIPPAQGPTSPFGSNRRAFLNNLADEEGVLPRWSQWWKEPQSAATMGIDRLARDTKAFAAFEAERPRMSLGWFDDVIDLAAWDHVPAGYIQTCAYYDRAAEDALRRGWPVKRLNGTHLHPTLEPDETAAAIAAVCEALLAREGEFRK
jgi:hypothetical protein